jgi:hypothetical protein
VDALPTHDPGLDVPAGAPPQVQLSGEADPASADQQKAELDRTAATQSRQGAADAAAPAGENAIRPTRPREVLQPPEIAKGGAAAGGKGAADAGAAAEGLAIIANEKKGREGRAALAQAQAEMASKKGEHQQKVSAEKRQNDEQMAALRAENAAEQAAEKAGARSDVAKARSDWTAEQRKAVDATGQKAGQELAKGHTKVQQEQRQADHQATLHIGDGEREASEAKAGAERDAAAKKAEAKRESGGVFGWLSSKVSSFFNALKRGITAIFDAAKKLVRAAIDKAKKLAVAVIEAARKAIVSIIKAVGAALIALGDALLAAFPNLKRRFRSFIEAKVKAAENAVNRLADALKKGVTKLLDALGKAFEFLLDAYKKAMFIVLDAAKAVVDGAIKAAKAVADLVGTFIVLIKDIAANPGGWIANLGAAVMDGVKNHLWKAFKTAVKGWFDDKLEQVLGVGTAIWNVLKKGGIAIKDVGKMAFEALKAAIPQALIQLLVEKVAAMIVPAAGAVMAIIEGLQAAWGTVQRIIAALGKFVSFLKAVKSGGAGPGFAELLASAAIVVIDFVANWLLKKLRGPASKVGSKVMAKVKAAMKKVGGALKKVARKIGGVFKKGKKRFDDWRSKRRAKKDAKNSGKTKDASQKQQDKDAAKQKKRDAAYARVKPKVATLLAKGIGRTWLGMRLRFLGLTNGLTSLSLKGNAVVGRASPELTLDNIEPVLLGAMLEPILVMAEDFYLRHYDHSRSKDKANETQGIHHAPANPDTEQIMSWREKLKQGQEKRAKGLPAGDSREPTVQGGTVWWRNHSSMSMLFANKVKGMGDVPEKYSKMIEQGALKDKSFTNLNPELQKFLASLGSVERARKLGMMPAMDLANTLHAEGVIPSVETVVAGKANPMAPEMGAVAAHRDDGRTDFTTRKPADLEKISKASDDRRTSIGLIFKQLRSLLNADRSIVTKAGSAAQGVAQAVERWFKLQASATPADRGALIAATKTLVSKLMIYLKTYRS